MKYKTAPLSEICIGGGSYGISASAVECSPGLPTYLRITDINDDGTLNISGLKSVDDPNSNKYYLSPNDIVFARTGASTGRNYFYDGADGEFVYAGFLIKFSIDPQKVNPLFVKYYCQSRNYFDWIGSFNTGSTRGNINAQTLGKMPIPVLPRSQQDLIADTLSVLDSKIAENKKINHHLEQVAQTIFKSWFVDFEPFANVEFIDSELGTIPKGWQVARIGDLPVTITDFVANGSFASLKENVKLLETPSYAVFIRNVDLKAGSFGKYVDRHSYSFLSKSALYGGEVIISNVGDVGSVFLCPYLPQPMTLGNNIIMLTANERKAQNYFFYLLFKHSYGAELIRSITGGSAQPKFNKTDFRSLRVVMPSAEVMDMFLETVECLFKRQADTEQEISRLTALRDALLLRLLSGELSIADLSYDK